MLVVKYTLRGAAVQLGLKREALRKFVQGDTENPHMASRKRIAEAYLRYRGPAMVAEGGGPVPEPPDPAEIRLIFADREAAYRFFDRLHQAHRAVHGEDALPTADAVRSLLRRLADAAFASDPAVYAERRRRRRPRPRDPDPGE